MFPFDSEEPSITHVALKHVSVTGKFSEVRLIKISSNRDEALWVSTVGDLEQTALDDCEGSGGVQKYVIQGLEENGTTTKSIISRLTLRYTATRSEEETGFDSDSEPANAQGITAQIMRHNEARERIDKAAWGNIINTQRLTIETLTEQNAVLMQKHLDMIETIEELASARHQRELETMQETNKAENRQRVARTLTTLLPAVVKKLTGADIGPVTDPDTLSMRAILQSLKEDQLEQITAILTPEQSMALLSMVKGEAEKPTDN